MYRVCGLATGTTRASHYSLFTVPIKEIYQEYLFERAPRPGAAGYNSPRHLLSTSLVEAVHLSRIGVLDFCAQGIASEQSYEIVSIHCSDFLFVHFRSDPRYLLKAQTKDELFERLYCFGIVAVLLQEAIPGAFQQARYAEELSRAEHGSEDRGDSLSDPPEIENHRSVVWYITIASVFPQMQQIDRCQSSLCCRIAIGTLDDGLVHVLNQKRKDEKLPLVLKRRVIFGKRLRTVADLQEEPVGVYPCDHEALTDRDLGRQEHAMTATVAKQCFD